MRIGLDARTTEGLAGVAEYGRQLTNALTAAATGDDFVVFRKAADPTLFWTAHVSDRWRFLSAKLDLLHVLGGAAPWGYRQPYVLTVHDLAIYKHPEWFPDGQWFSTKISYPSSLKLARHIIVPSLATKNDLMELFKVKADKISVIPHGVTAAPPSSVSSLRGGPKADAAISGGIDRNSNLGNGRYLLFIGTLEPRKNVIALVHAYRLMVDRHPEVKDVELRLVGAVGWKAEAIIDEIRKTQCEGYRISLLGAVSAADKWQLLADAACFVSPSLYEGFGLPALEAMAAGAPVICADNSSFPEVVGGAALRIPANDVEAWAEKMFLILRDQKIADELRAKGLARAAEFSWEKTAGQTLAVYRQVIASR